MDLNRVFRQLLSWLLPVLSSSYSKLTWNFISDLLIQAWMNSTAAIVALTFNAWQMIATIFGSAFTVVGTILTLCGLLLAYAENRQSKKVQDERMALERWQIALEYRRSCETSEHVDESCREFIDAKVQPPPGLAAALTSQYDTSSDVFISSGNSNRAAHRSAAVVATGLFLLQVWLNYELSPYEIEVFEGPPEKPTQGQSYKNFDFTCHVGIFGWIHIALQILDYTLIFVIVTVLISPFAPDDSEKASMCLLLVVVEFTVRFLVREAQYWRDMEKPQVGFRKVEVLHCTKHFTWYGSVRARGVAVVEVDLSEPKPNI